MTIPTKSPDDLIESADWNLVAALINGTVPADASFTPVKYVQYTDAASYAFTAGNQDTTNGLIAKYQYGLVAAPTTVMTVAKAGIDHQVLATFLTTGKAIAALADTPKNLDNYTARSYTRLAMSEGTESGGSITSSYAGFDEQVYLSRYWAPGSTSSTLELIGYNFNVEIPAVALGTANGSGHVINAFASNISSFGTTAHTALAARFSAYSSQTGGANIGAWGSLHQVQVRAGNQGFAIETNTTNANAAIAGGIAAGSSTIPNFATFGLNILGTTALAGSKNTVGLMIQASTGAEWWHGIWFRPGCIATGGYGIDAVNVAQPIRIGNASPIFGLKVDGTTTIQMMAVDAADRLSLRNGTAIALQDATAVTDYALFSAGSASIRNGAANGQTLDIKHLTELTTIAAAATTDTAILMPANAIVLGVSVRVTTVIPTAATFTVGDSGSAARFSTAAVSTAANSTDLGTKAGAYYNATALAVRITPNLSPANNTGRVRVTIHYLSVTVPTS